VLRLELDHVAVAVRSITAAVPLFRDALGGEYLMGGDQEGSWRWVQFRYPNGGKVELLEPLADDGFLVRFLEQRGEGLHHITFKTDDIRAAIAQVEGLGYEVVDVALEDPHWKEAFLRPSKAHGTLIQLAQSSAPDDVAKDFLKPGNLDELLG
jgi:methylmalonyl-CoA/ethylmalonyl-CoA epimerase